MKSLPKHIMYSSTYLWGLLLFYTIILGGFAIQTKYFHSSISTSSGYITLSVFLISIPYTVFVYIKILKLEKESDALIKAKEKFLAMASHKNVC